MVIFLLQIEQSETESGTTSTEQSWVDTMTPLHRIPILQRGTDQGETGVVLFKNLQRPL